MTKAGAARRIVIKEGEFPAPDHAVEVTAVCDEQDPWTRWTIRVTYNPKWRLKAVPFPRLLAVPAILGEGMLDDRSYKSSAPKALNSTARGNALGG